MANLDWMEMFPAARSEYLRFEGSDHRPLLTHFDDHLKKKKGIFRYDRRLNEKPEVRKIVEDTWKASSTDSVLTKINQVRRKLVEWAKAETAASKELLLKNQALLEQELSSQSPNQELIDEIKGTLSKAYAEEEEFWRQRSRIQWLNGGDRNSTFFHAVTRGRRACNKFTVIENEDGEAFYTENQIVRTFSLFYQSLFAAGISDTTDVVNEALSPKVTADMNSELIKLPDKAEVQAAAFSINPGKAPGPDGFSAGFYQTFWDVIGDDVYRDVRAFFETSCLHPRQNETHLRLIPKITGAKRVSDYRPIALCNTHYKIIAKILARRLQPLLKTLISPSQSAFVPGRAIADNVLITHEILHYLRKSGAKKRVSMAVKTDMSKAYDRIEWSFLRKVLQRLGFHETWISWLMACVSTVSYSFLINGGPQGSVKPSRGLRQGDPLSPYLLILCTEVLSGLCKQAQLKGTLPGVKVAKNCPPINHLLFADDTMFFGKSNAASCGALLSILERYEKASGQCINRGKSAITFSSKTSQECRIRVKATLNMSNEGGIGKHLGLPEHFGRKKRDIFASIVDRIKQRAHGWTARYLSGAGKMVLLKAVLAAMPTYAMSCFKLPKSLCKQIQSVLTRFWWDAKPELRKMCWVSWDRLTLPKSEGGLGFREIEVFNDALLAKHTWRLLKDPDSLLAQTLLNKYCKDRDLLTCSAPNSASHGWRGILAGREIIKKGLGWAIGNGESVRVWHENWLSTTEQLCPIGPPTEQDQNLRVKDLLNPVTTEWSTEKIKLHLPQYEEMILKLIPSTLDMKDERVWLFEKSGTYSTKSGYAIAKVNSSNSPSNSTWKKSVWNVKCSPKLNHFLWKLKANALAVGETLLKCGIQVDGKCQRCGAIESVLHVMLTCPFAQKVWKLAPIENGPSWIPNQSMGDVLDACVKIVNLPPSGLITPLYPWIFWVLWTSRNQLRFEDKSFSETEMMLKAIKAAKEWQAAVHKTKTSSASPKDFKKSTLPPHHSPSAFRIYSDAAWNSVSGAGGLGWVATDPTGATLFEGSSARRVVASVLSAEALALKEGLTMAVSAGIKDAVCYSDSRILIEILTGNKTVIELKGILHDLGVLSKSLLSVSFCFTPRSSNVQADMLAKNALFWYVNNPARIDDSVF